MHVGAVQANDRALVVDDLIATRVQLSNLSEMDDEALDQGDGGWIKEMEEVAATATTSRSIMPFRAIHKGKPLSVSLASRRSPPLSSRTPGARRGHKRVVPRRREEEGHVA